MPSFSYINSRFKNKEIGIYAEHISFSSVDCHIYGSYQPYHEHFDNYDRWCKDFHLTYNYDNRLINIENTRKREVHFWRDVFDFQKVIIRGDDGWDLSLHNHSYFDAYIRKQHNIVIKQKNAHPDLELATKLMFSFRDYALNKLTIKYLDFRTSLFIDSNPPIQELKGKRDRFLEHIQFNNPYDVLKNIARLLEEL